MNCIVINLYLHIKVPIQVLQRGNNGDGCVLASTLCKYDLRKGDLFDLS